MEKCVEIYKDKDKAETVARVKKGTVTEVNRFQVLDCRSNCMLDYLKEGDPLYLVEYTI